MTRRRTPAQTLPRSTFSCGFQLTLAAAILIAGGASELVAHPNHDAIAEMDWNPKTRSLEVALQVNARQLERVLSENRKAVDLDEQDPATEKLLKAFVEKHVRLTGKDGRAVQLTWVGADIKVRSAWLYFEFILPKGESPIGYEIANSVFFAQFEDQTNTVALKLKDGEPRTFLRFSKDSPVAKIGVREPNTERKPETKSAESSESERN